jgi:hypothetical protein
VAAFCDPGRDEAQIIHSGVVHLTQDREVEPHRTAGRRAIIKKKDPRTIGDLGRCSTGE